MYQNPVLDWAINGKGEAPSLAKAKALLKVLQESQSDAIKLLADLEERHKRALQINRDLEAGLARVQKHVDEKSKPKTEGESEKS
jgi:hypothetical protein